MEWKATIQSSFSRGAVYFTNHAKHEMEVEEFGVISTSEIIEAVDHLEVLGDYPDDTPYPSALIFGITNTGRPIHFVCAFDNDEDYLTIVTVYQPDPDLWVDFKKRKRQ